MSDDHQDTDVLIAYLRGELDGDSLTDFEQRLLQSESLRRELLELSVEESALVEWARTERVSTSLDNTTFPDISPAPEISSAQVTNRSRHPVGWWAAAAILLVSLVSLAIMALQKDPEASTGVAHLVATVDANWEGESPILNASMASGHYQLRSGSIDLLFSEGARVSVSGPARFQLASSRHIHLDSGNLVAQIPDEALGFIVTSPQSEVIDLGTEFGLSVDDTGRTDIHVLEGLVEVLPSREGTDSHSVMIEEGQARRFADDAGTTAIVTTTPIPLSSRAELVGNPRFNRLGLQMLRGSVRIVENLSKDDLFKHTSGRNWIDLIRERQNVTLPTDIEVSIDSPGSYRDFSDLNRSLPTGTRVDSYLLHFRPGSSNHVNGVIQFDRPIAAVLCTGKALEASDSVFGISTTYYPSGSNPFRGLEPNGHPTRNLQPRAPDWMPDELVLSQDRTTLSIRTFANTERGYDQIRILTVPAPVESTE